MTGSIFYLTWFGRLLPCLEKEEDKKARQAVHAVNAAGISIAWYPKGSLPPPVSATTVANNVVNFLKSAISSTTSSSSTQPKEADHAPARLMVRDNPDSGKPELFVDPMPVSSPSPTNPTAKTKSQPSVGYKLNIELHRVGAVDMNPNTGMIKIMAKRPKDPEQSAKVLICLELTKGGDVHVPVSVNDRDLFVHHLLVLMEWERQRRAAQGLEDDDEEEERGNFLTLRAQKAAHFAKRELELQTTKRQRESRKAKLVQDSGGLKYTALAMMQRQENAA